MKFIMVFHEGDWGICMMWVQSWDNNFEPCKKYYLLLPGKPKTALESTNAGNFFIIEDNTNEAFTFNRLGLFRLNRRLVTDIRRLFIL